jgi:tetratricopeptide (TPR) repeat protein
MSPGALTERDLAVLRSLSRRIDPADPGAHNNLGVLYYERGLFPEAIAAFAHALELDPRMTIAQQNLELVRGRPGTDRRVAELRAIRREPRRGLRLDWGAPTWCWDNSTGDRGVRRARRLTGGLPYVQLILAGGAGDQGAHTPSRRAARPSVRSCGA